MMRLFSIVCVAAATGSASSMNLRALMAEGNATDVEPVLTSAQDVLAGWRNPMLPKNDSEGLLEIGAASLLEKGDGDTQSSTAPTESPLIPPSDDVFGEWNPDNATQTTSLIEEGSDFDMPTDAPTPAPDGSLLGPETNVFGDWGSNNVTSLLETSALAEPAGDIDAKLKSDLAQLKAYMKDPQSLLQESAGMETFRDLQKRIVEKSAQLVKAKEAKKAPVSNTVTAQIAAKVQELKAKMQAALDEQVTPVPDKVVQWYAKAYPEKFAAMNARAVQFVENDKQLAKLAETTQAAMTSTPKVQKKVLDEAQAELASINTGPLPPAASL